MTIRTPNGKVITSGVFIAVCVAFLITPAVFAQKYRNVIMDGLIRRIDRQSRVITLWEYRAGDSTWDLQVPGSVNMRTLQVGDYVQVMADASRRAIVRIRKLAPPKTDDRYQDAIRRIEAETGSPGQ
ncbi:MAG: hypothetical protein ACE5K9_02095 [Candidatus Methylomirabilales bacterium]